MLEEHLNKHLQPPFIQYPTLNKHEFTNIVWQLWVCPGHALALCDILTFVGAVPALVSICSRLCQDFKSIRLVVKARNDDTASRIRLCNSLPSSRHVVGGRC